MEKEIEELKSLGGDGAMESKKKELTKRLIGKVAVFIERIRNNWHFGKRGGERILWHGDEQGAVPTTQSLKRIKPPIGADLRKFFEKEGQQQPQFGVKFKFNPYLFSWNICKAEIAKARRQKEQKKARFLAFLRQHTKSERQRKLGGD